MLKKEYFLPSKLKISVKQYLGHVLGDFTPKLFLFPVTLRCNSQCVMCNIWQEKKPKDMTIEQIKTFLSDPAFKTIEKIILTGGEPTLRPDLNSIIELIANKCPNLRALQLATNGFSDKPVLDACNNLDKVCQRSNIEYAVLVSLDGVGKVHDKVRGVPGAFGKASKTVEALVDLRRSRNFGLHVNCVISRFNIYDLGNLINWCSQKDVKLSFQLAHKWKRFGNKLNDFSLTADQEQYYAGLLWSKVKATGSYYDWMAYRMIRNGCHRSVGCPFLTNAFSIYPDGSVYCCPDANPIGNVLEHSLSEIYSDKHKLAKQKQLLQNERCWSCYQSAWWQYSYEHELLHRLQFGLIKKILTYTN